VSLTGVELAGNFAMVTRNHVGLAVSCTLLLGCISTARPALAEDQKLLAKIVEGTEAGVRMEVLGLTRDEGGLLTLRLAFVNESGGQIKNSAFPGKGNVENFALLDNTNRRKYLVVRDSGGGCLCTSLNPFNASDPGRRVFWAKFGSPPASVDHVTLLMPDSEPVDGVPIAR
jgi:hypothetical protein